MVKRGAAAGSLWELWSCVERECGTVEQCAAPALLVLTSWLQRGEGEIPLQLLAISNLPISLSGRANMIFTFPWSEWWLELSETMRWPILWQTLCIYEHWPQWLTSQFIPRTDPMHCNDYVSTRCMESKILSTRIRMNRILLLLLCISFHPSHQCKSSTPTAKSKPTTETVIKGKTCSQKVLSQNWGKPF